MKAQAINRINKFGRIGGIVTNIMKVLAIIGAALLLISAVVMTFFPKDFVKMSMDSTVSVEVDLNAIGVEMTAEEEDEANAAMIEGMKAGTASVNSMDATVTSDGFHNGVANFRAETVGENFVDMKTVAVILYVITLDVVSVVVMLFFLNKLFKEFAVCETPFNDTVIMRMKRFAISLIPMAILSAVGEGLVDSMFTNDVSIDLVNFPIVVAILVIFALTYIFKYGAVLQQESDETI